jgi:hypothetical protein
VCVLRVVFCVLCVRTTQNYRSTKSNYKETTRSETTSVGSRSTCVSLHRSSKGSFSTSHTHITYTHTDTPHGDKNRKKFLSRLEPMSTRTLRIRSSSCTITLSYCLKRKEHYINLPLNEVQSPGAGRYPHLWFLCIMLTHIAAVGFVRD